MTMDRDLQRRCISLNGPRLPIQMAQSVSSSTFTSSYVDLAHVIEVSDASIVFLFRNEIGDYIGYPGTCVAHDLHGSTVPSFDVPLMGWTKEGNITYIDDVFRARIPINYHVGCMGLAPESHDFVDSIPPMPTGGNLDNKRIGIGMTMYYPVEVAGALISMGDAHAAQGDSELDGTGIETSITGKFKFTVIKKADLTGAMDALDFPLGETKDAWIVHG